MFIKGLCLSRSEKLPPTPDSTDIRPPSVWHHNNGTTWTVLLYHCFLQCDVRIVLHTHYKLLEIVLMWLCFQHYWSTLYSSLASLVVLLLSGSEMIEALNVQGMPIMSKKRHPQYLGNSLFHFVLFSLYFLSCESACNSHLVWEQVAFGSLGVEKKHQFKCKTAKNTALTSRGLIQYHPGGKMQTNTNRCINKKQ